MPQRKTGNGRAETPRKPARGTPPKSGRKVRYAVVGLGYISQVAVLPAFRNARRNSELVALVSDDPKKLRELSKRYRAPAVGGEPTGELLGVDLVAGAAEGEQGRAPG